LSQRERQSFIGEARRNQIINAAITTLDEIGYVNASLAQIAKRADISTALISYHFKDKVDLMNHTLMTVLDNTTSFVMDQVNSAETYRDKLHSHISASLEYQSKHRPQFNALLEIIFNARTDDNTPYYKISDGEEDDLLLELQAILREGQNQGEFRVFNVQAMSNAIQGAIGEFMGNSNLASQMDALTYSRELIGIFDQAIIQDQKR
jgi:TetR/AcrR family transcriptional regulator, transcriptional repressor of bet genes